MAPQLLQRSDRPIASPPQHSRPLMPKSLDQSARSSLAR